MSFVANKNYSYFVNVIPLWLYPRILFFCWYRITDLWVCYIECLTCLRDNVPCLLTCSRAHVSCVLKCWRANVLTCSFANVPCVPTYSCAMTSNNKKSFQWHTFLTILVLSLFFFLWNKTKYKMSWQARMSLETFALRIQEFSRTFLQFSYQVVALNGWCGKLCTVKWFDFCLSRTLRVIFKSLINGEKWIITGGK